MPSPLLTAALSTFESLAMLWAEPRASPAGDACADAPPPSALTHAVRVAFVGPAAGALVLAVSDDVATELAASMLGLEPGVVQADARLRQDALGEVANVICGNVLPLVAGRTAVFHLGAPEAVPAAEAAAGALPPGVAAGAAPPVCAPTRHAESLLVAHGCAELVLYFEAPLPGDACAPASVLVPAP